MSIIDNYVLPCYDETKYTSFQEYWSSLTITANNVNRPVNEKDDTLLHYVCRYGTTQMLQELFHRSFYVNRHPTNKNQYRPIHEAAAYNNYRVLKMLIRDYYILPYDTTNRCQCSPDNNHQCLLWHSQVTPLYIAAMKGHEESVRVLIEEGAIINIYTEKGWSVMNAAVYGGNHIIIRYLMERRPDYPEHLFTDDPSFKSFVGLICSYGQRDTLDIVKQFWGNKINRWNEPLVYYAVQNRCSPEFLRYLLSHESVGLNQGPETPLKMAMTQMNTELIKILVEHGARV